MYLNVTITPGTTEAHLVRF